MTPEEYDQLIVEKHYQRFKKGEYIFRIGQTPTVLYCVYAGKVKLVRHDEYGNMVIVRLAREGDLLGYRSLLGNTPYKADAIALTDVSVCTIPVHLIRKALKENPEVTQAFFQRLAQDLSWAESRITAMATQSVRERIMHMLLFLEMFFGVDDEGFINLPLSRTELAQLIGTAPETLIRQLHRLEEMGFLELSGKRRIRLLQKEKMLQILALVD